MIYKSKKRKNLEKELDELNKKINSFSSLEESNPKEFEKLNKTKEFTETLYQWDKIKDLIRQEKNIDSLIEYFLIASIIAVIAFINWFSDAISAN